MGSIPEDFQIKVCEKAYEFDSRNIKILNWKVKCYVDVSSIPGETNFEELYFFGRIRGFDSGWEQILESKSYDSKVWVRIPRKAELKFEKRVRVRFSE